MKLPIMLMLYTKFDTKLSTCYPIFHSKNVDFLITICFLSLGLAERFPLFPSNFPLLFRISCHRLLYVEPQIISVLKIHFSFEYSVAIFIGNSNFLHQSNLKYNRPQLIYLCG